MRTSLNYLSLLRKAVREYSDSASGWDYSIGGKNAATRGALVLESNVVASLFHRMIEAGIAEETVRVDSKGMDLTVFDGDRVALSVQVKRITNADRAYVEGGRGHEKNNFVSDIKRLAAEPDADRAFVVFDPLDRLRTRTLKNSAVTWEAFLRGICLEEGVTFLTIGPKRAHSLFGEVSGGPRR